MRLVLAARGGHGLRDLLLPLAQLDASEADAQLLRQIGIVGALERAR